MTTLSNGKSKQSQKPRTRRHLSPSQQWDICHAYDIDQAKMIDLAAKYGVCRQCIYKVIKKNGINTSKQSPRTQIKVSCSTCGTELVRTRARIRKQVNHFCSDTCYFTYLEAGNGAGDYQGNRQGQRIARKKVSALFDLQPGNIVHHKDRNTLNNMLDNLSVFANQGDHIRYHRLGADYSQPIWDGSDI